MTAMETASIGSASGGMVGASGQLNVPTELESGFLGAHAPEGVFDSLKGMMLAPYELDGIESTSATSGAARAYAPNTAGPAPTETIEVNTPLTHGGGSFAK